MGAAHQTRLSFMRTVLRRIKAEGWAMTRPVWRIDGRGVGVAVYEARGPQRTYSLVCFGHDLPPEKRSDRVIATEWDATFALFDGVPSEADLARLAGEVPRQEAGRCRASELVLSRANRSVRLFDHVVERLAAGRQPEAAELDAVGYLMRTTAVYGNGKFGLADRALYRERPEAAGPYRLELLAVWLIRAFTADIAEHLAAARGGAGAVRLDPPLRRRLGVGNSTGLGMAPYMVTHPALMHHWFAARETALARVRALPAAGAAEGPAFLASVARARLGVAVWRTDEARQAGRVAGLAADLGRLADFAADGVLDGEYPWDALWRWAEANLTLEGQEACVSLLIEPHGRLVDDLAETMACDERLYFRINGAMSVGELARLTRSAYDWALAIDFADPAATARFWYASEEKLEPRLGERWVEPGAEREQRLGAGRDAVAMLADLEADDPDRPVAGFLLRHPGHRHAARRVQIVARLPYADIRDNVLGADLVPVDILRCKLAFFGATAFDPKSDRWVRINMYQHAPFPDEIADLDADDWAWPPLRHPRLRLRGNGGGGCNES